MLVLFKSPFCHSTLFHFIIQHLQYPIFLHFINVNNCGYPKASTQYNCISEQIFTTSQKLHGMFGPPKFKEIILNIFRKLIILNTQELFVLQSHFNGICIHIHTIALLFIQVFLSWQPPDTLNSFIMVIFIMVIFVGGFHIILEKYEFHVQLQYRLVRTCLLRAYFHKF